MDALSSRQKICYNRFPSKILDEPPRIVFMNITSLAQLIWSASAVALVALILLHSPKGDGIGGIGGQAQLFTSAKTAETTLNRITWSLFVVFIGITVVLSANWLPAPSPASQPATDVVPAVETTPDLIPDTIPAEPAESPAAPDAE